MKGISTINKQRNDQMRRQLEAQRADYNLINRLNQTALCSQFSQSYAKLLVRAQSLSEHITSGAGNPA